MLCRSNVFSITFLLLQLKPACVVNAVLNHLRKIVNDKILT